MRLWFRRMRLARTSACTECGKATARESRLCASCERERERRASDARQGFSVDLAGYVRIPADLVPNAAGDAAGAPLHD